MADNETIKALEYCSTDVRENTCPKCAFYKEHRCSTLMLNAVSDLINRKNAKIEELKTEIERLKAENKSIRYCYEQEKSYNDTLAESCEKNCKRFNMTTRSEAIKDFVERLKEKFGIADCIVTVDNNDLDDFVKELTEGK